METLAVLIIILLAVLSTPLTLKKLIDRINYDKKEETENDDEKTDH